MSSHLLILTLLLANVITAQPPTDASTSKPEIGTPIVKVATTKPVEPISTNIQPVQAAVPVETPQTAPVAQTPSTTPPSGSIQQIIIDAANSHGVSADYLLSVAKCESTFNPNIVNAYGYTGLFQYSYSTWANFSVKAGYAGASIFDPVAQANVTAWAFANNLQSNWSCA